MCGRLRVGKSFLHVLQHRSVQPCVRPLDAVHMTAKRHRKSTVFSALKGALPPIDPHPGRRGGQGAGSPGVEGRAKQPSSGSAGPGPGLYAKLAEPCPVGQNWISIKIQSRMTESNPKASLDRNPAASSSCHSEACYPLLSKHGRHEAVKWRRHHDARRRERGHSRGRTAPGKMPTPGSWARLRRRPGAAGARLTQRLRELGRIEGIPSQSSIAGRGARGASSEHQPNRFGKSGCNGHGRSCTVLRKAGDDLLFESCFTFSGRPSIAARAVASWLAGWQCHRTLCQERPAPDLAGELQLMREVIPSVIGSRTRRTSTHPSAVLELDEITPRPHVRLCRSVQLRPEAPKKSRPSFRDPGKPHRRALRSR